MSGSQIKIDAEAQREKLSLDVLVDQMHLLDPHKVVTDIVWEDIWITELEAFLIDSEEFQSLHWVLQLGASNLVYPSATHTRFSHALGTLEASQRILSACNVNHRRYGTARIGPYAKLLARLGGLLHDVAQMPYAHTLDLHGEGHLFETEWKDGTLRESLLGQEGIIRNKIAEFFNKKYPNDSNKSALVNDLVNDLKWTLVSGRRENPPVDRSYLSYVKDIIGNTLCADLFDYVQRDLLSVGFRDRVSLRPLGFFCVKEQDDGSMKLALALFKPKDPEKMREDVVFEAIEFLRKRYSLSERVYFHHAKMAASAMLIKSVDLSGMKCHEIWEYGDHELLIHLAQQTGSDDKVRSAYIANLILRRELFKLASEKRFTGDWAPGTVERLQKHYATGPDARDHQRDLEDTLAECLGFSPEQVVVYSPDPDMNLKAFDALVWPKRSQPLGPLRELKDAEPESKELYRKHQRLWRLCVFVARDLYNRQGFRDSVEKACNALLDMPSADIKSLAEAYIENHKAQLSYDTLLWQDRDKMVEIVKNGIAAKARGGYGFPRPRDVLDVLKK